MVITTTDSEDAADELARGIVEATVGACAQVVGPIKSAYRWEGKVSVDQEWQIWIKTTTARLDDLTTFIKANHSYDLPEIVATPIIGGSAEYLSWVTGETQPR
jgi:periplasmic divalent cation tolerance protein